jgi:hypothetical protein
MDDIYTGKEALEIMLNDSSIEFIRVTSEEIYKNIDGKIRFGTVKEWSIPKYRMFYSNLDVDESLQKLKQWKIKEEIK